MREQTARGLEAARARTLQLTDLDEVELTTQHSPLMSPLVWDLAHIGQQEDLWLLRGGNAAAQGLLECKIEQLYDAFEHPRASRIDLPLLSPRESRSFIADVRGRVFDGLDRLDDPDPAQLFPYVMVEQHEQQHVETMLATHQLRVGEPLLGPGAPLPPGRVVPADSVLVPAGPFTLGVDGDTEPWSLDNERPAHTVDLPAFRIARVPVTNGEWQAFIDAGGYDQPHWWSERGWRHRVDAGLDRPLFWAADGSRRRFGIVEEIPADEPVQHVCFFEAEAYAAWAGARLPTEQEWEKACAWDPVARTPAPLAVGRLGVDAGARQPRRRRAASGARRCLRGRSLGLRRRADDRRRLGVDVVGLRALAGLRDDALRRLQQAVLRRRLQGPARRVLGGGWRVDPPVLPQLGPADPPADLHRAAAGLGRARRCVGTSPGSASRAPSPRSCSSPSSGCCGRATSRAGSPTG